MQKTASGDGAARMLRSLESVSELSDAAKQAISQLPMRIVDLDPGEDFVREGQAPTESCSVTSGFVCRYKVVGDGQRQIMSFHLPGEIPDCRVFA